MHASRRAFPVCDSTARVKPVNCSNLHHGLFQFSRVIKRGKSQTGLLPSSSILFQGKWAGRPIYFDVTCFRIVYKCITQLLARTGAPRVKRPDDVRFENWLESSHAGRSRDMNLERHFVGRPHFDLICCPNLVEIIWFFVGRIVYFCSVINQFLNEIVSIVTQFGIALHSDVTPQPGYRVVEASHILICNANCINRILVIWIQTQRLLPFNYSFFAAPRSFQNICQPNMDAR